jgi:hypothetical protein
MALPPESERPYKAIATPPGEPTKHEPLTDEEWMEHLDRIAIHNDQMAEQAKVQYSIDRQAAYEKEIYPRLDEAKMKAELEGDSSLKDELKAKKIEIDSRFPPPAE